MQALLYLVGVYEVVVLQLGVLQFLHQFLQACIAT